MRKAAAGVMGGVMELAAPAWTANLPTGGDVPLRGARARGGGAGEGAGSDSAPGRGAGARLSGRGQGDRISGGWEGPAAPPAVAGMRIGLLGGSFDPAHAGHVHITLWALRAFRLDRVWWLVSPGNPLKPDPPADLVRRVEAAGAAMTHRRVEVTDLERRLGTRLTADTLAALTLRHPGVHFVWLMGADNLRSFHLWDRWREILARVPVGVLARPGEQLTAGLSPAARAFARARLPAAQAGRLATAAPPCWTLLSGPMLDLSSSGLRAEGAWTR